ncbi:hypothetical protein [Kitasatospora sp. NPDC097691]|uniref:hypothetical protein n=1 Tax=Kitasatospora sp. NPDC097691 TaxID=3157231 RepID=UPI003318B5BA
MPKHPSATGNRRRGRSDLEPDDYVRERMKQEFGPMAYPEGEQVQIHVVLHHYGRGVVAERSYQVTGFGEALGIGECAYRAGIKEATWRGYVARGQAPAPDVPDEAWLGRWRPSGPHWRESTLARWMDERLGAGHRSDLDG